MTRFAEKSFTVGARRAAIQCEQGHMEPDRYGKCMRCGTRIESPSRALREYAARIGGTIVSATKRYRVGANGELTPALPTAAPCSDFSKPEDWG